MITIAKGIMKKNNDNYSENNGKEGENNES